jgi:hypothetical protein
LLSHPSPRGLVESAALRRAVPPQGARLVNEELQTRYADDLAATLGGSGRMIANSKSGYSNEHPGHVAVFNANVCVAAGKIWHGDLDLTRDESKLGELASRTGQTVYVLYEYDARFENERSPLLRSAVYEVTPSGHNRYQQRYLERAKDGSLRRRPPAPGSRCRLVFAPRWPRLLRFWQLELVHRELRRAHGPLRSTLIYIGQRSRHGARSPLLVLGLHRRHDIKRSLQLELTFYPASERAAPAALLRHSVGRCRGRLRPWAAVNCHQGVLYELNLGFEIHATPLGK